MATYDFGEAREFALNGRWAQIDSTLLFWTESGSDKSGDSIMFLHGIPTWSWLWRGVIEQTGLSHHSVAVDMPGFGMSDKAKSHSFRIESLADTVEHFLDDSIGSEKQVTLAVHDMGALVGAELIRRNPARYPALVIMNTSLRPDSWAGGGPLRVLSVPYLGDASMALARPWMLRMAMQPFVADPKAKAPERVAGYWYPFEAGFGSALARLFREKPFEHDDFGTWRKALEDYPGKSLIIWGERDPVFTSADAADLHTLLPDAEVLGFENASHFVPEERPHAVGRRIQSFLADQGASVRSSST